jgi:endo-1,4-beta-xylanase
MRGHVLVWHSQTPVWFFRKDYKLAGSMVDKQTMNARMEWYIKTVLNHVADWEAKNNDGKHIIYAWDVVNEAASDSAAGSRFLRGSNGEQSNWYAVYKDDSFIVNAFRFANKYAPADVLLSYNDYNTYSGNKTTAILKIIDDIQAAEKDATLPTRLNVLGMQSHVSMSYPSVSSYESAVKIFLAKGLDVQVTELDIANGKDKYDAEKLKAKYKEYFTIFLNNRKGDGKNGITGVTIWGIDDATTWLNALGMYKGYRQYPLLFNADYTCKPAFYGVIEAARK